MKLLLARKKTMGVPGGFALLLSAAIAVLTAADPWTLPPSNWKQDRFQLEIQILPDNELQISTPQCERKIQFNVKVVAVVRDDYYTAVRVQPENEQKACSGQNFDLQLRLASLLTAGRTIFSFSSDRKGLKVVLPDHHEQRTIIFHRKK